MMLDNLELSSRTYRWLKLNGYVDTDLITQATDHDLLRLPNFGHRSLCEIKEALAPHGMRLATPIPASARPKRERRSAKRDAAIYAAYQAGAMQKNLAAKYGLTKERICQICQLERRRMPS